MKRPDFDWMSVGNLARIFDGVPLEEVRRVLEQQRKNPKEKFGELLVRLGIMSEESVAQLLHKQREFRDGKVGDKDLQRIVDFASSATEEHGKQMADAVRRARKL